MKKSKRYVRICAALLCAVLCLTVNMAPAMAAKVTQADIDALKGNAASLDKKQKEIQSKLNSLKNDKAAAVQKKTLLDDQIANTNAKISNTEAQISDYNALISQAETELADAQQREEAQYELFCKRVREMEERGTISYWSVLFKATSISDLLNRLEFVNEVAEYDRNLIEAIRQTRENIKTEKTAMEEQEQLLAKQQDELQQQVDEAAALIAEYAATQKGYEELAAAEEKEAKEIESQIKKLLETSDVTPSPGGFIWPVSTSKIITSPMGGRVSPGGIGSTNHRGVDIGGVGTTSAAMATKAGKVILAKTVVYGSYGGSGYGNYVVVDHGGGYTTLYAHLTSVSVSVGQMVSQGDTVGITGSTGNSTGPHLHYEVMINGVNQNPLDYLPGYIARW